ncbi:hypothetical protein C7S18_00170 [Ahniella affigens]|uniref:Uncharacterized protein n=1 Tax=Ahniella affigens TaxID=2021234 RepID=A0A2P1PLJ6_9GAMM|nr:hypothetical protein [Ahniella affigens]AVP95702.1 hypothetical protein C7S18_00170 [Ahniella affigens]
MPRSNQTGFRCLDILLGVGVAIAMASSSAAFAAAPPANAALEAAEADARRGDLVALRTSSRGIEQTLIESLRRQLPEALGDTYDPSRHRYLQKSLAALGDAQSRSAIINDFAGSNRYKSLNAFEDAAEIGGNDMIRAAIEQLDNPMPGGRPIGADGRMDSDVAIAAPRFLAVILLSRLVTDPTAPRLDMQWITYDEAHVERWKAWWAEHGAAYR